MTRRLPALLPKGPPRRYRLPPPSRRCTHREGGKQCWGWSLAVPRTGFIPGRCVSHAEPLPVQPTDADPRNRWLYRGIDLPPAGPFTLAELLEVARVAAGVGGGR